MIALLVILRLFFAVYGVITSYPPSRLVSVRIIISFAITLLFILAITRIPTSRPSITVVVPISVLLVSDFALNFGFFAVWPSFSHRVLNGDDMLRHARSFFAKGAFLPGLPTSLNLTKCLGVILGTARPFSYLGVTGKSNGSLVCESTHLRNVPVALLIGGIEIYNFGLRSASFRMSSSFAARPHLATHKSRTSLTLAVRGSVVS